MRVQARGLAALRQVAHWAELAVHARLDAGGPRLRTHAELKGVNRPGGRPALGTEWYMPRLAIADEQLARFCRKQHIRRLSLFGSALAGTSRLDSDIDLLVEFEPGCEPGLLGLASMEAELAVMLGGKKVDLRTPQDLSRYFRDQVLRTAEVQYAG